MEFLRRLIESDDPCWLIALIIFLIPIGAQFVQRSPGVADWGIRIAVAISLLFAVSSLADDGIRDSGQLFAVVLRSVAVGAVIVGPLWIVLSVLNFVWNGYCRTRDSLHAKLNASRAERERRRQEALERERRRLADLEWERTRPERERQARIAAERDAEAKRLAASHQSRRENARAACELLFSEHAPEIGNRFPRSELDRFIRTYMADTHPVEEVERRGIELQAMIHQHRVRIHPDPPKTIQSLAEWYLEEKTRIESLPLEEDLRQTHLMQLDFRYAELSEELLQRAKP